MKKIFLLLPILALIGGFVAYKMWTKPHEDMQSSTAGIASDATALYAAFSNDEATANATYLEKVVEVTGKVTEVTQEAGSTKVMLEAGADAMGGVYCEMDPLSTHERSTFATGENLRLKCHCTGYSGIDVQMVRCVEAK